MLRARLMTLIVPVTIKHRKGDIIVDKDEFPRAGVTAESISGMRTAFKKDGTVTAAITGINDGAAVVAAMSAAEADKRGLTPLSVRAGRRLAWILP